MKAYDNQDWEGFEKVVYEIINGNPGDTIGKLQQRFLKGSDLDSRYVLRKVLKHLTDQGKIMIRRELEGEAYYTVETFAEKIEEKARRVGRDLMDEFRKRLYKREWGDTPTGQILQPYPPGYFSVDLTHNSLKRSENNWKITDYDKGKFVRAHGERAGDVELDLLIRNFRDTKHYDELSLYGKFKRKLKESARVTPSQIPGYLERIFNSFQEITERTQKLDMFARRFFVYARGDREDAMSILREMKKEKPERFKGVLQPILGDPMFRKLKPTRKEDQEKREEFLDYMERRINEMKI